MKARTCEPPSVPVPPVTVMVTMPPTWGGVGPLTTVVTLLALALIVLCTEVMLNVWVTSGEAGGRDE